MDDFPSRFRAIETDRKLESRSYGRDSAAQMQRHTGMDLHLSGRVNPSSLPWTQITDPKDKGSSSSWQWGLSNAESKRRKRVVRYKAYGTEGKIKASIRSSFRWIKNKYSELVHGS